MKPGGCIEENYSPTFGCLEGKQSEEDRWVYWQLCNHWEEELKDGRRMSAVPFSNFIRMELFDSQPVRFVLKIPRKVMPQLSPNSNKQSFDRKKSVRMDGWMSRTSESCLTYTLCPSSKISISKCHMVTGFPQDGTHVYQIVSARDKRQSL